MILKAFELMDTSAKLLLATALLLIAAGIVCIARHIKKKKTAASNSEPHISSSSVIGSRDTQQDYVLTPQTYGISDELRRERGELVVLCDGMGGLRGGAYASQTCCRVMLDSYYKGPQARPGEFFRDAMVKADKAVAALTDENGDSMHAGTTLVAVIVKDGILYWASVGDSRIYMMSGNRLKQLTRDHNYLMRLMERVRRGEITESEALNDPKRDALISYMGIGHVELMDICAEGQKLRQNDIVILCSDGLYKSMSSGEIEKTVAQSLRGNGMIPAVLTSAALAKSWLRHDNITVAVVDRLAK